MEKIFWDKVLKNKSAIELRIIFSLFENQPLEVKEIIERLDEAASTVYDHIRILSNAGIIVNISETRTKKFVLPNYIGLLEVFKRIKNRNIDRVSLTQLANELGKTPDEIERRAYELAKEYQISIVPREQALVDFKHRLYGPSAPDYFE